MNYNRKEDLHVYESPGNGQMTMGVPVATHRDQQYKELRERFKDLNINIVKNIRQAIYSELDQLQALLENIEKEKI